MNHGHSFLVQKFTNFLEIREDQIHQKNKRHLLNNYYGIKTLVLGKQCNFSFYLSFNSF